MSVSLHVEPTTPPISWLDFCQKTPKNSIALDGYVSDGPKFDTEGPRANFNHHENCDRLATRATCGQVTMAIRQGLFSTFIDSGYSKLHIFVNDCDEDVCTSVFLLRHGFLAKNVNNPAINRLVYMEDALDCTAGAYPFPTDMPVLRQLAWVFEPYRRFRLNGGLDRKNSDEYTSIISDVENRIMLHVAGNGESVSIDTRYEICGGGRGWVLIREQGMHAKTGLFADGHQAFISVRDRPDGNHAYTIGKMAFAKFDIPMILNKLNEIEGCTVDCWGGSNTIGGSPRVRGSKLPPSEITKIVNSILHQME